MKIDNKRLNERILNFNESVKRRNEVAEYYFGNGINKTMEHFVLTKQASFFSQQLSISAGLIKTVSIHTLQNTLKLKTTTYSRLRLFRLWFYH